VSYIARFFKWVIGGIIHFLKEVIMWTIRQIISIIRFATPYVFRIILAALWIAVGLSIMNLLTLFRPVRNVARKLAEEWSEKFVRDGKGPSLHQPTITKIFYIVALIAINVGFLLNLSLVVFTGVWVYQLVIGR
jgi:hypothetical protein